MSARWIAVALAAAALVPAAGCGDDEAAVAPVRTADPVVTFAPAISLHSRERFFPVSASHFLDWSTFKWEQDDCIPPSATFTVGAPRHRAGLDDPALAITDPSRLAGGRAVYRFRYPRSECATASPRRFAANEHTRPNDPGRPGLTGETGFYLDFASDELEGQRKVVRERGQAILQGLPVYWERLPARVDGRPGLRIVYWHLYGYTAPPEDEAFVRTREGGWDRVSVLLRRDGRERYTPESVRYHAWDESTDVPWTDTTRVDAAGREDDAGTHPLVLHARGSHAAYAEAGDHEHSFRANGKHYEYVDRTAACPDCPLWRTWRHLLPVRDQPWYGFGGGWGRVFEGTHTTGALGPSPFRSSD